MQLYSAPALANSSETRQTLAPPRIEVMLPERRRLIRLGAFCPAIIEWRGRHIASVVINATPFGLRLDAALPLDAIGDQIVVNFADQTRLNGTLRWSRGGHIGIGFQTDDPAIMDRLQYEHLGHGHLSYMIGWQRQRREKTLWCSQLVSGPSHLCDIPMPNWSRLSHAT
jgi:hypothetical protein